MKRNERVFGIYAMGLLLDRFAAVERCGRRREWSVVIHDKETWNIDKRYGLSKQQVSQIFNDLRKHPEWIHAAPDARAVSESLRRFGGHVVALFDEEDGMDASSVSAALFANDIPVDEVRESRSCGGNKIMTRKKLEPDVVLSDRRDRLSCWPDVDDAILVGLFYRGHGTPDEDVELVNSLGGWLIRDYGDDGAKMLAESSGSQHNIVPFRRSRL